MNTKNNIVKFIKSVPEAIIPSSATSGSICLDIYSCEDKVIYPGSMSVVNTGIIIVLPSSYEAQVRPRSGLSIKGILVVLGTIDTDYMGTIGVIMFNTNKEEYKINIGDRIAQLAFAPKFINDIIFKDHEGNDINVFMNNTRKGGFGSTGR